MEKRLFEILDEMNQEDTKNGTRLVAIGDVLDSSQMTKKGSKVTMRIDHEGFNDIMSDKAVPLLILVNKEEYFKRKGSYGDAPPPKKSNA